LKDENAAERDRLNGLLDLLMNIRKEAKSKKDYATSDKIRNQLLQLGILMKDEKDGRMSYNFE
jgi:cysteinyl-tRNA synthetase